MASTTNLAAVAISATQINLSWLYISFNSDTSIERSDDEGTSWTVIPMIVPSGVNNYSDTGLTTATKYSYRIRKTDWDGYSEVVSATTL